jgi:twinkle protein
LSKVIKHGPCPECGSKDNLAIYEDHEHCFSFDCTYHKQYGDKKIKKDADQDFPEEKVSVKKEIISLPLKTMPAIKARGLDTSTVAKYKVTVNTNPESDIECVFPLFDENEQHIANQIRLAEKQFKVQGSLDNAGLFGQQAFPAGGRSITITEGYYDAMAGFQLTGSRYPNVGVMSSSSAKKEVVRNFEYVNSFGEIILNFDNDKPGQEAAKLVASLFAPGKVRMLKLEKAKDANDYLMQGLVKDYINEWHRAAPFMPDGLLLGNDQRFLEELIQYKEPRSIPYPWDGLNHKTYGIRTSELVLLTADTGDGKTTVMKEIEYSLLMHPELIEERAGVGFLHLEEPKRDLAFGLMSVHNSKPYHFPDVARTEEELREAYKAVLDTDRVVIWDHFGSNDIDVVLAKIRHMAALGCRYIMVDHLSIIVSDQSGDERKQLDEISTKIKTLTMNLDIAVFCVIHINRQGQVRGSAGPEQVANIVIRLERNKKDLNEWRRNITRMTVEKNRKYGRTGPACYLYYNEMTGRLEELPPELVQEYEMGGNGVGHEFDTMRA